MKKTAQNSSASKYLHQRHPLDLAQEDDGRKIGHVLKRQQLQEARPTAREASRAAACVPR